MMAAWLGVQKKFINLCRFQHIAPKWINEIRHRTGWDQNALEKVKVKQSRNRPSVAQRVPGGLGSQISMTFGT